MIERMEIEGFQVHKERLSISFDKHITTIVGRTDSGKSTIIRALRWVFLNQPSGDSFLSWDSKFARVLIVIDGHTIIRKKGSGANFYKLDGKKFKAFGTTVPEEIAAFLRIDEVNFQFQLDSPFWFMESPGQVSRELNRIVNLGVIDLSLSNITSVVKLARSKVQDSEDRLKNYIASKRKYRWTATADNELRFIEKLNLSIMDTSEKLSKLRKLLDAIRIESRFVKAPRPDTKELDELLSQYKATSKKRKRLEQSLRDISRLKETVCHEKEFASKAEKLLHEMIQGQKCPVCGQMMTK